MERGGGDVASLKQDSLAVSPSVVTRLAIDRVALVAALEKRVVNGHGDCGNELTVRSLPGEKSLVLLQPADRDRSGNGLAQIRAVEEEAAGRLRQDLRLVVHAVVDMDGRTARSAAPRATGEGDRGRESERTKQPSFAGPHVRALSSRSGFGLRTLDR